MRRADVLRALERGQVVRVELDVPGREEVRVIGPRAVRLFPIYHPAAALYTRSLLDTLRADFARLPDLLALDPPPQPEPPAPEPVVEEPEIVEEIEAAAVPAEEPAPSQLGLF